MRICIVVDMQNDFVTGALGSKDAQEIVPELVEHLKSQKDLGAHIYFTQDTHHDNYLDTLEGKKLPVIHCVSGTEGHDIIPELKRFIKERNTNIFIKYTFGSIQLLAFLEREYSEYLRNPCDSEGFVVEFCGVCTNICVVSNALLARAAVPDAKIIVWKKYCAGTSKIESDAAFSVMNSCQIDVI